MLTNYSQEQFWLQYRDLPDEVKDLLWDENLTDLFFYLVREYNIPDKVYTFSQITDYVIMGLIPVQKYRETLQVELGLPETTARQLAYEVRDKLFVKIGDYLRKTHNIPRAAEEDVGTQS
ncbi:MAG: hypothetical protein HYV65_01785 [Candidatus Spechtbacteria bacterium]|nr:hypothetical protein [Candidatus Spechtbacteria bacterium]